MPKRQLKRQITQNHFLTILEPTSNTMTQQFTKSVSGWTKAELPSSDSLEGKSCRVELLTPNHAQQLWVANCNDVNGRNFNYLPYGHFKDFQGTQSTC